jgi:dimethylaniline monooxygenase (N-oxide forming)
VSGVVTTLDPILTIGSREDLCHGRRTHRGANVRRVTEPDPTAASAADAPIDSATVTIAAPADAVWDMVADVTRMGEWSPECYSCRWVGKRHEPVAGARFVGFNKRGWARWFTTNEVEVADRGRAFVFRTRETGVRWGYRFEPDGDGSGTRVTETRDLADSRTWLIRLAGPFVGGMNSHADELRVGMVRTLDRLKAAAESA